MSKKKPYSKIVNAKMLRAAASEYKKAVGKAKKDPAFGDFMSRLITEEYELTVKLIKLSDYLWVRDTSESPSFYSPEAKKLHGKYRQLMVRQFKAMDTYKRILVKRIEFLTIGK